MQRLGEKANSPIVWYLRESNSGKTSSINWNKNETRLSKIPSHCLRPPFIDCHLRTYSGDERLAKSAKNNFLCTVIVSCKQHKFTKATRTVGVD